ncbi:EipB family protein, partial [Enterococcus faecium]|uniref:EipB family protein n=1 Tax=Enterococcus faecium TaxID=1352 RepID=UPI0034E9712C
MFEWADACDGWTVQQNMHLDFTHAEGGASTLSSNEVTWESKDGKHYNFNIRRLNDGKETENYRGKANIAGTNSKAVYSIPDSKNLALTDAT